MTDCMSMSAAKTRLHLTQTNLYFKGLHFLLKKKDVHKEMLYKSGGKDAREVPVKSNIKTAEQLKEIVTSACWRPPASA